ncbi:carbonic anhydrase [Acrasis kona]|uniref:Carbonic anhydrase n=1 Tax=Acrasis kona TaxID=1008807 RepID=A0AAW2YS23_9EUKA
MKELLLGMLDFRRRVRPKTLEMFKNMALGQNPDCIFMACSDSRVVPNLFASTNPGHLFVLRNVGNLIPKPNHLRPLEKAHEAEGAAFEFGIGALGVTNIIVCGHSECGAMIKLLSKDTQREHKCDAGCTHVHLEDNLSKTPYLDSWLRHGSESLRKYDEMLDGKPLSFVKGFDHHVIKANISKDLSPHNQLSQINVIQQLENISQYSVVKEKLEKKEIELHGWWFDIKNADVYSFSEKKKEFVLIDDAKAEELLEKIGGDPAEVKTDAKLPYWMGKYFY